MSNEVLYGMMTDMNDIILSLQEDIIALKELHKAHTGDTITIQFDSDTNMPGSNDTIRMPQIDNLFAFSESFGTAAVGE